MIPAKARMSNRRNYEQGTSYIFREALTDDAVVAMRKKNLRIAKSQLAMCLKAGLVDEAGAYQREIAFQNECLKAGK